MASRWRREEGEVQVGRKGREIEEEAEDTSGTE